MKQYTFFFGIALLFFSCASEIQREPITNSADYDKYLLTAETPSIDEASDEVAFWSDRLNSDSTGVGDLGPLAAAYHKLFDATGDPEFLRGAEDVYRKAMAISANNKDIYARGLARTYVSQHRFQEAAALLQQSYEGISSKRATEMMLFDVYMELGQYTKAEAFLKKVKNNSDYNYLIRKAKWSDHIGDLTHAINYLESAKKIAESRDSRGLKIWTYSNLADFYGHAGRIYDAYQHYLKTLALQPDNAYAMKGIAWIAYSYEHDYEEAERILHAVMERRIDPSYNLLMADIKESKGEDEEAEAMRKGFFQLINENEYGAMYATSLIELYAETDIVKAMQLADEEVAARATPEANALLAYATLGAGQKELALEIIRNSVEGKTHEPMAAYYAALVFKANGMSDELKEVKQELSEASFELGPVLSGKISDL